MTIQQIKLFLAIKKFMNFSVAADESYISQSSLSKQIKALENELYVTLFNRSTRNITITSAGMEFAIHAQKISDEYDNLLSSLRRYSAKRTKSITINSIPVMSQYNLTDMIALFENHNPDVELDIIEKDTKYVMKSLENSTTDLAIIRTDLIDKKQYKVFPLVDDEMVLITNKKHDLAKLDQISLMDAANENFIFLSEETYLYKYCIDLCIKAGFVPHIQHTDVRLETISKFVEKGIGVSLLMKQVANHLFDNQINILPLKEKPVLTLSIITHNTEIPQISNNFIKFASNYFNS